MTARDVVLVVAGLALLGVLSGCETTAEKSARLAADAKTSADETGLSVTKRNPRVRVVDSTALTDANGSAVVVTLRDTASTAMAGVPVAIDVRNAAGRSIFRNDQPGAEAGLVSAPLLVPGRDLSWVHDQVQAAGERPARVAVRVGEARVTAPASAPRLTAGRLQLTEDASGTEGRGRVTNHATTTQRDVTVYAVARRGAKIVAAGRALVPRIAAGGSAPFAVYFIGEPAGARITLAALPATASETTR